MYYIVKAVPNTLLGKIGLDKAKGDLPEKENETKRWSLRFAVYKQFVWWIYQRIGKENRNVLPSYVLWKFRQHYPEANGQYVLYKVDENDW